jgi:hypothetical protein
VPLFKGFIIEFSSSNLKDDINEIESDIIFIVALVFGFYITKRVFLQHEFNIIKLVPENILSSIENQPIVLYFVVLPIIIFILFSIGKLLLRLINAILFYPVFDGIENSIRYRSSTFKRLISAVFQLPRSVCYVLLLAFILNILSLLNINNLLDNYLLSSSPYNYLCKNIVIPITNSKVAKQLPSIINNSFKIQVVQNDVQVDENKPAKSRTIVYYNGVTLDEGVKSNESIDSFAKKLIEKEANSINKAKVIYEWIGSNIDYDNEKANSILNNDFNVKSGAISTFQEKKGICFDYSCLYVAMCRKAGVKVRIVTGDGFNGVSWVSHAWNQVYNESEGTWINVDSTFYKGGNYFNSKRFDIDHRNGKVVGEW